eukprot:187448_1
MRVPHKVHFMHFVQYSIAMLNIKWHLIGSVRFGDLITIRQPATNSFKQKHDKGTYVVRLININTDQHGKNTNINVNYDSNSGKAFNCNRSIYFITNMDWINKICKHLMTITVL